MAMRYGYMTIHSESGAMIVDNTSFSTYGKARSWMIQCVNGLVRCVGHVRLDDYGEFVFTRKGDNVYTYIVVSSLDAPELPELDEQ